ncbi:YlxR family protein [Desertihabitans brevis]|uniref:YlxR family protein n=1 Tax=Desertihabitans brevis TaxID=2268447 RepID=A0A367YX64_9ACTN|nr:YlxR family RNase P modulator [Desertihabitans brevis]RCK70495.1 YlxR family protein [Desertihabitans brevis]
MDQPVRTCVGCRRRSSQSELIRLVARPGTVEVLVDRRRSLPGRGAYVHPDPACTELAVRRRAIGRALRLEGVDPTQVSDLLASLTDPQQASPTWSGSGGTA